MPFCFELAQDRTSRGPGDIGHVSEVFVADIDFDRPAVSRAGEAAISGAKQNRHETLQVVSDHQVVGSTHSVIEMLDRQKAETSPGRRVAPDDLVKGRERQMQQFGVPRSDQADPSGLAREGG